MNHNPFSHLPDAARRAAMRKVAPHIMPLWKGSNRVKIVPREAKWTGQFSGMKSVRSIQELKKLLEKSGNQKLSIYFYNDENIKIDVNEVYDLVGKFNPLCVVYVQK